MPQEQWTTVDRYITDLLIPADPALDAALRRSDEARLPSINVSANQGKLLHLIALIHKARNILEFGTLGGYSAIWLARALPPGGQLITLEVDPDYAEVARVNIADAELTDVIEIRVGPALDTLPQLESEGRGPFDLFFLDADKAGYPEYFKWALRLSRRGSVIIADNVVRGGKVIDEASVDANVQGVRRFNELLSADTRVSATIIQTVGCKGHDGLAIAVVTGK